MERNACPSTFIAPCLEDESAQKLIAEARNGDGEVDDQDLGAELWREVRVRQPGGAVQAEALRDVHL